MIFRRDFLYVLSLIPASIAIWGNVIGGWYTLGNVLFSFIILGVFESLLGKNENNEHSQPRSALPEIILYLHVVAHSLVLLTLFYGIFTGTIQGVFVVFAVLSSAVEGGSGAIIIAHELVHKAVPLKRILGQYLLLTCGNYYFYVHHLRIHHKYVGTAYDAATAKRGESLYRFFGRTVLGQTKEAWTSESQRLKKMKKSPWGISNILLQNAIASVVILMVLFSVGSWPMAIAWLGLCVVSNFLLEYVNYIEHYGLVRDQGEKVDHHHSWNCDKVISRFFLIDLSRHADHHNFASKPYHTLNTYTDAPSMPGGYVSMILPALVPQWWFRKMHPILDSPKKMA